MSEEKEYYFGFPMTHLLGDKYFAIKATSETKAKEMAKDISYSSVLLNINFIKSYNLTKASKKEISKLKI